MLLVSVVNAEESLGTVRVFNQGMCPDYLKYDGKVIEERKVSYKQDGTYYPVYSLDRDLPGIGGGTGEKLEYNVEMQDNLTNTLIWRVLSNSFPYVGSRDMGAMTVYEAFVATKQAVESILYGKDISKYEAIDAAGERVLTMLKNLVDKARNSDAIRPSAVIDIVENSSKWQLDSVDKNYFSKTYIVNAKADFNTYEVSLEASGSAVNSGVSKLPEGTRIVDINNVDKGTFNKGEMFKVLIPVNHSIEDGEFVINIATKLKTCPVYFGKAPEGMQNFALTADPYEEVSGSLKQSFSKNNSKIVIVKKDGETNETLKGTAFCVLDSNKKIVYSNLITDSNGMVTLSGVLPGTYYLQEVRATDGYAKLDELVKFTMEFDKEIILTVNNKKVQKSEINVNTEEINVNVEHKESNVDLSTGGQNISESKDKTNTNVNEQVTDKKLQNVEDNVDVNKLVSTEEEIIVENTAIDKAVVKNKVNNNDTVKKLPKTGF